VHQHTEAGWKQRNNHDTLPENLIPCPNINVENTICWKRVQSILDDMSKFWESACTPFW